MRMCVGFMALGTLAISGFARQPTLSGHRFRCESRLHSLSSRAKYEPVDEIRVNSRRGFVSAIAAGVALSASSAKADLTLGLFGNIKRKYVIEKIVDGKVVGRKRGISVEVCSDIYTGKQAEKARTIPFNQRAFLNDNAKCGSASDAELSRESLQHLCDAPCEETCEATVSNFVAKNEEKLFLETGKDVGGQRESVLKKKCIKACKNKCNPRYHAETDDFFEIITTP